MMATPDYDSWTKGNLIYAGAHCLSGLGPCAELCDACAESHRKYLKDEQQKRRQLYYSLMQEFGEP